MSSDAEQHVGGLDVAMHDARLVRVLQRLRDLPEDPHRPRHGQPPLRGQHVEQRAPLHQAHGQEAQALALADVVDADDVLVRDLAREQELAPETGDPFGITPELGAEDLDRDVLPQLLVARAVDHAHAAEAELPDHPVAPRDHRSRGQPQIRVRAGAGVGHGNGSGRCGIRGGGAHQTAGISSSSLC